MTELFDVVVVGAGPAGLAAAATAVAGGLRVALIDAGNALGGQFWRHPPVRARSELPTDDLHHGLAEYRRLTAFLDAAQTDGRLTTRLMHDVWTVARDTTARFAVHTVDRSAPTRERAIVVHGERLIIATGAYDRQLPFPGWDLPGVFTVGGLQALLKGGGVAAGATVAIGGTGPFLLPVATGLAARGVDVVAVCEAAGAGAWLPHMGTALRNPDKLVEGVGYAGTLARQRIRIRPRTAIVAAEGTDRVTAVTIAALDATGRPRPGTDRRINVDAVGTGWGFVPQLDLALTLGAALTDSEDGNRVVAVDADQRTSVPQLYAAGETTGIAGAAVALREGQVAAEAVLADAGREPATSRRRLGAVRRELARGQTFARAMRLAHPVPPGWAGWLSDDTTLCRCEEVDVGAVRAAIADGAADHRQVKQLTRAGMGWCQGRICAPVVHSLVAPGTEFTQPERLVAAPVRLGALAAPEESVPCDIAQSGRTG